jgi:SOS response regulatory protein OraA/RecX
VTALLKVGRASIAVELDGAPWRTLPLEAVFRAGLEVGRTLDRPRARLLRRELRRLEALAAAGRALRGRELSEAKLSRRLERAGVAPRPRAETLQLLTRAGLVDDRRAALGRAAALGERGYGDAWIRWDLKRQGIADDIVADAIGSLDAEALRAARIVSEHGDGERAARRLARRGFGEDAVEAAVTAPVAPDL